MPIPVDDRLIVRSAASVEDVERVAAFNGTIHGPGVVSMTRSLYLDHPHTTLEDLFLVEDARDGRVLSSICLIPWTLRCAGADIPAGEMGVVGTLDGYRQRGLIRAQVEILRQRLGERGCLLSHIQGIPYYYRQFGYEYALPLEGGLRLETRHVPDLSPVGWRVRLAVPDDLPLLMRLYDEAAEDLDLHAVRDEATWRYVLTQTAGTEMEHETWLVEDDAGRAAGYVRLPRNHFDPELAVDEISRLSADAALAMLCHLKRLVVERGEPGIRLNLPEGGALMALARALGAHDLGRYAWQVWVPDFAALLRSLGPALERRLAASPFAGLTRDVCLSSYRQAVVLRWAAGRLAAVSVVGATDRDAVRLPPFAWTQLVLGYRTLEDLGEIYPDVLVAAEARPLVEALFPRMRAFLYTVY